FGADALRFTLAAMAAQGRDIKLSEQRVEGYRNFATKLWNAARFAEINGCVHDPNFDPRLTKEPFNRWIAYETGRVASEITEAIKAYRFNDAAAAIYHFIWNIFCDRYLEVAKPILSGSDSASKKETQIATAWALDEILLLLHPFMPFITEELWRLTAEKGLVRPRLLALEEWPDLTELQKSLEPTKPNMNVVFDVVGELRTIRTTYNIAFREPLEVRLTNFNKIDRTILMSNAASIARLANTSVQIGSLKIVNVAPLAASVPSLPASNSAALPLGFTATPAPAEPRPAKDGSFVIQAPVKEGSLSVALPGSFDVKSERARLENEVAKTDAEISRADQKLNNQNFVTRAPEDVVEEEREKRGVAGVLKAKLLQALSVLLRSARAVTQTKTTTTKRAPQSMVKRRLKTTKRRPKRTVKRRLKTTRGPKRTVKRSVKTTRGPKRTVKRSLKTTAKRTPERTVKRSVKARAKRRLKTKQ
ncbi:MAG TPA: class I tRNA ligase family protein, partial [Xanthobacteraceae bacterium]|nr:class I tRNA ligase family protein [Xanthobacteraceae bacterium]